MTTPEYAQDLRTLLLSGEAEIRRDLCAELPEATLAEILTGQSPQSVWELLSLMRPWKRAAVFGYFNLDFQVYLTENINKDELADLLTEMSADERVDLFKRLPEDAKASVFPLLAKAEREDIRKLSSYEENMAGSVMTSEYVTLTPDLTVTEALEKLRLQWPGKETIYYVYVIGEDRRLLGFVSLRKLILAKPSAYVGDIMKAEVIYIRAVDPREKAADLIAKYDLIALPVVNGGASLIGIITHDDALDVVTEEATEDMLRMASTDSEEYENSSILQSIRLRSPWLTLNLATAMLSSFTVSRFQDTISSYVMLAALMPIIAGLGGNAGTQTLAVTVRGIALGKIPVGRGRKIIMREASVGLLNGAIIGLLVGAIAFFVFHKPWLGLIMLLAMVCNLIIAGLLGSAIPLALKALKLDPALGSSIFITAATDISGFFVFLSLATLMMPLLQ
ncbi:MAG: magnesium transporter [Proteobacteria bacterium]|nr:magnesium transporter [Pseudomonadota bacterium]MBU4298124.1 magnesium transporter [Pseudomonadota bacterium]MCG2747932.1 magnesium transporter [Desulfobulbaceae bacterium]